MRQSKRKVNGVVRGLRGLRLSRAFAALLSGGMAAAGAAQTTTITNLAITSGGMAQSTVSSGTAVKLSAMVTAGSAPVTPGQVEFCDASSPHCTGIHLLGLAQFSRAGLSQFGENLILSVWHPLCKQAGGFQLFFRHRVRSDL